MISLTQEEINDILKILSRFVDSNLNLISQEYQKLLGILELNLFRTLF